MHTFLLQFSEGVWAKARCWAHCEDSGDRGFPALSLFRDVLFKPQGLWAKSNLLLYTLWLPKVRVEWKERRWEEDRWKEKRSSDSDKEITLNHWYFLFRIWKSWLVRRTEGEIQHSDSKGHSPKHDLSPPTCGCLPFVQGPSHRWHSLAWTYIWPLRAGSLVLVHWSGKENLSLAGTPLQCSFQPTPHFVDQWAETRLCLAVQELLPLLLD